MCLIVKKGTLPVITTEDIVVYKEVCSLTDSCDITTIASSYFPFEYTPGVLYKTEIKKSNEYRTYDSEARAAADLILHNDGYGDLSDIIHGQSLDLLDAYGPGFHFAASKNRICDKDIEIMEFTIPAGSEVIYDESGLGVTNQIILNK